MSSTSNNINTTTSLPPASSSGLHRLRFTSGKQYPSIRDRIRADPKSVRRLTQSLRKSRKKREFLTRLALITPNNAHSVIITPNNTHSVIITPNNNAAVRFSPASPGAPILNRRSPRINPRVEVSVGSSILKNSKYTQGAPLINDDCWIKCYPLLLCGNRAECDLSRTQITDKRTRSGKFYGSYD